MKLSAQKTFKHYRSDFEWAKATQQEMYDFWRRNECAAKWQAFRDAEKLRLQVALRNKTATITGQNKGCFVTLTATI